MEKKRTKITLRLPQSHEQKSHANVHAVLGLAKVGGARIRVERRADLVDARQRMHHDHLLFRFGHELRRQHVHVLGSFVLLDRDEAFFLDARHVEHVGVRQRLFQRAELLLVNARLVQEAHDLGGHLEKLRTHVSYAAHSVDAQQLCQRVNRSTVF